LLLLYEAPKLLSTLQALPFYLLNGLVAIYASVY
jgi:hypothetical protein